MVKNLELINEYRNNIMHFYNETSMEPIIFSLLTKDINVINLCAKIMIVEILLEIGRAVNITLVRALQTSGDVIFPTTLAIIFCWGVATIGSFIFGVTFKMGIIGVWIAMSIDELARAFIFIIRFKKEKWAKIDLVEY